MSIRQEQGFTLIEIMLAVVLLSIGVMALVGSSAMVTRMIGRGKESTYVGQMATARAERVRQLAASTSPPCGVLASGSAPKTNGVTETWTLQAPAANGTRDMQLIYSYAVPRGIRADTMVLTLLCK